MKAKRVREIWAKLARSRTALLLLAAFSAALGLRLYFLFRSPLSYGMDGGWYLLVTQSTLEHGIPQPFSFTSTPPLFFWLSGVLASFTEINSAVKLAGAWAASFAVFTIFLLARHLTRRTSIALVASALTALSPPFLRLLEDLKKNALAAVFLPLFFYFCLRAKEGKRYLALASVAGGLMLISHPQTFVLAFVTMLAVLAFEAGFTRKIPWIELKTLLAVGVVLGLACLPFLGAILGTADALRANEGLSGGRISNLELLWQNYGFLWVPCIGGFVIALARARKKGRAYLFPVAWLLFALLLSQPLLSRYSHRLTLLTFFPVVILVGVVVEEIRRRFGVLAFGMALALVLALSLVPFWELGTRMRPLIREKEVPIFLEVKESVPEDSLVVVPHWGLRYWVQYLTGLEVELRLTPELVRSGRPIYAFTERRSAAKLGPWFKPVWRRGRFNLYKLIGPPGSPAGARGGNPGVLEEFQSEFPGRKILDSREFRGDFWRMYVQAREENALVIVPKEIFKLNPMLQDLFLVCSERRGFLLLEPRLSVPPPPRPLRAPAEVVALADAVVVIFAFPAQLFNYLSLPAKEMLKAAVGLPLTFLWWGFVLGGLSRLKIAKKLYRKILLLFSRKNLRFKNEHSRCLPSGRKS